MFNSTGSATSFPSSEVSLGTTKPTRLRCSYQTLMHLISIYVKELKEWVKNLELSNGRAIVQHFSKLTIQTDASKKG